MAYAFITDAATAKEGSDTVTTTAIDTTGADLIVACVSAKETGDPTYVFSDSKTNTWTPQTERVDANTGVRHRVYYVRGGTVGASHTFTASTTGGLNLMVRVAAYSGSAASPADLESYTDSGGSSVSSLQAQSLTPSEDNCLVVSFAWSNFDNTLSVNSPFTRRAYFQGVSYVSGAVGDSIQTTAAAAAPTWSLSGDAHTAAVIQSSFKAAAAATGQFARPASDVADGNWLNASSSNTNLYASIDEETAGGAGDDDYIRSGATPSNDTCTVGLSGISTPGAGTVTMRIRARYL